MKTSLGATVTRDGLLDGCAGFVPMHRVGNRWQALWQAGKPAVVRSPDWAMVMSQTTLKKKEGQLRSGPNFNVHWPLAVVKHVYFFQLPC